MPSSRAAATPTLPPGGGQGGKHNRLTTRRGPAVLIPWADVEQITLYSSEPSDQAPVQRIGIERRNGAAEARKITGWRLDRDRMAALTAMMAPDVHIAEAVADTRPGIEGPIQAALSSSTDPRIKRRAHPCCKPSGPSARPGSLRSARCTKIRCVRWCCCSHRCLLSMVAGPNRIGSSGRGRPKSFKLGQRPWPVPPELHDTTVNCNPDSNLKVQSAPVFCWVCHSPSPTRRCRRGDRPSPAGAR